MDHYQRVLVGVNEAASYWFTNSPHIRPAIHKQIAKEE
jgi:hypothetical protein